MSDLRKFCIGMFTGLGISAAALNHHLWQIPTDRGTPTDGMIVVGLTFGCLAVIMFGQRARLTKEDG